MLSCSPFFGLLIDKIRMNGFFMLTCSCVIGCSLLMLAQAESCNRCWAPYPGVVLFALGNALISPSVSPSIPIVASKGRLAFVFSMFRAFGATSSGLFSLMTGLIQQRASSVRSGYYWVSSG